MGLTDMMDACGFGLDRCGGWMGHVTRHTSQSCAYDFSKVPENVERQSHLRNGRFCLAYDLQLCLSAKFDSKVRLSFVCVV